MDGNSKQFILYFNILWRLTILPSLNGQMSSQSWTQKDFPNPQLHAALCGRSYPGWICDPGHILNQTDAEHLNAVLYEVVRDSDCSCSCKSYKPAVAIVRTILPSSNVSQPDVQQFADYLLEKAWSFGDCGNGLVVVMNTDSNTVKTSTGPLTQKVLSTKCIQKISSNISRHLSNGEWSKTLNFILTEYRDVLLKKSPVDCDEGSRYNGWKLGAILGSVAFVFFIGAVFAICQRGSEEKDGSIQIDEGYYGGV